MQCFSLRDRENIAKDTASPPKVRCNTLFLPESGLYIAGTDLKALGCEDGTETLERHK